MSTKPVTEEELILRIQYPRVTFVDVQQAIESEAYEHRGLKVLCHLTLKNGFQITGESACAVPGNWKKDVGERLAKENAISKVWAFLGYELKTQVALVQKLHEKRICPAPGYKAYVTQEAVWAMSMNRGDYNDYRGWQIPEDEDPLDEGYLIVRDGHQTWVPEEQFDANYKELDLLGEGSAGGPTWKDRVEIERDELTEKVDKLCQMMESPRFKELQHGQQQLLEHQLSAMQQYLSALTSRLTLG